MGCVTGSPQTLASFPGQMHKNLGTRLLIPRPNEEEKSIDWV